MLPLACPVCHAPLSRDTDGSRLSCADGHSFDRARQGYWNLLLAQRKRSRDPGDNQEMVKARSRFLDAGHYQPIADQVNRLLIDQLQGMDAPRLLDLGCGEGYYTAAMETALQQAGIDAELCGIDISKHAIKQACKRSRAIDWLVATGADLPLAEGSLDALTLMFSRVMPEPMARVIKPGGLLLVVWPGPEHLLELRQLIYTEVRRHEADPTAELTPFFSLEESRSLSFRFQVESRQALADLLTMTPHGQRIRAEKREAILDLEQLECRADIRLGLYRRR